MRIHRLIPAGTLARPDRLGRFFPALVVTAAAFLAAVPAAQADPNACVEDGGSQYCGPPIPTPWSYSLCNDSAETVSDERAWCLASGGTSFNAIDGSCPGSTPFTDDNLESRAIAWVFYSSGYTASVTSDTGWGATYDTYWCGTGGPRYASGYYLGDARVITLQTTAGTAPLYASKGRGLECPIPYTNSTYYTDINGWMCSIPRDCPTCGGAGGAPGIGNPITPSIGVKVQTETDYRTAGGLELTRYYHALRFTEPYSVALDAHSESRFDIVWRSNYDRRVIPLTTVTWAVNASLTFPNGDIQYFNPTGGGVYTNGASARLVAAPEGWYYIAPEETDFFGTDGRLRSISMRTGQVLTMSYSDGTAAGPNGGYTVDPNGNPTQFVMPANRLLRATDAYGNALSFAYSGSGHIVTMTDPAGGVYLYSYDTNQELSSVRYPDGSTRAYRYNETANVSGSTSQRYLLTSIVDENGGLFATFKYDTTNRNAFAISTEHAGGADRYQLSYGTDALNQIASSTTTSVTDPLGTVRTFNFQNANGIRRYTGTTQAGGAGYGAGVKSRTVDANGNTTSQADFNNAMTCYAYDTARNLETVRVEGLASTVNCASVTGSGAALPAGSRKIVTQWHPRWSVPVAVSEPGRRTASVYNGDAGASCAPASAAINEGPTVQPIGVLCSKTVQATSDLTDGGLGFAATLVGAPRTTAYTYDVHGKVLTIDGPRTDVADVTTTTYYADDDPNAGNRGNVASITNALGQTTHITAYNAFGQPLTIVDPNGLATTLAYDSRMHLSSRSVGGETTSYGYDPVGQLVLVTLPDTSFLAYTYDGAHRLTGIADNLGNKIAYTLDAMGNRTQEQVFDPANALAQTRSRVYDALNRLFQDIGAQNQTTQYAYDNQGNVISIDGPLPGAVDVTANAYDALNRLVRVTDPNSGQTQYGYNGIDQLTGVTDPRNLTTTYNYDGLANLNAQVSPDTGTTQNTFDSAGNLLTQTDAKGQTTSYAYDALNRVASITFADGSKQTYAYDQGANGIGRLSTITETDPQNQVTSVIAYGYDSHGRTTSETRTINGVAYVTGYSYDSAGRLSGMIYPSGRTVVYSFDALGRISQVNTTPPPSSGGPIASNIAYQPFGGVKSYTLGNGQTYTRSYDLDGRIASYTQGAQNFALGYDAASRISFITDTANAANTNTYSYDNLDRLIGAALPNVPFAYVYDAVGNRTSKTVGASTDAYAYGTTSNQLTSIVPGSGPNRSFSFDANGSTVNDGVNQYVYDSRGRMVQSVGALGTTAYQVNALGQRIRKTNSTEDRVYLYDARGRLIAETDPGGTLRREYLYLNDIPLAVIQ